MSAFVVARYMRIEGGERQLWVIEQRGPALLTLRGKAGTKGRSTFNDYRTEARASEERDKRISAILAEGWVLEQPDAIFEGGLGAPAKSPVKELSAKVVTQIRAHVRTGFYDQAEVATHFCEDLYRPGTLPRARVEQTVSREFQLLKQEQRTWPEVTDCDRLGSAFRALREQGLIALENAGYTQSDGYDDVLEATKAHAATGYCFYHGQDVESSIRHGTLYLAFGPLHAADEPSEGIRVGEIVAAELRRSGLSVVWNGTAGQRIQVGVDWKRRV